MSIQIDVVRICGFRGIANLEMTLPRVTVLFGKNNSGKTTVIKALQLALGDYARYLSDEDFHIGKGDKRHETITVDIRFIPIEETSRVVPKFSAEWQQEFADKIQSEANGHQFVAIRTVARSDKVKGGYIVERFHLDTWVNSDDWLNTQPKSKNRLNKRLDSVSFISIDAQRDIHSELREKSSFIGRILSSVEYDNADVVELERMVAEINETAINKSEALQQLKNHLDNLNQSFEGSGQTELTPFPKKIRDLSKQFNVNFGESDKNSFSMEYHGMGTRSWASMLTVKAFTELMEKKHVEEVKPLLSIIAAEEPETHLHPNAQRTLFEQLQSSRGQIIISTHSPYLVGMSDLNNLRGLTRKSMASKAYELIKGLNDEDNNILRREIMRFRGELLFSKALILVEGVTEEQIIPSMFQKYFGKSCFSMGINCIGVNGYGNYPPFIKMAISFGIPVAIVSDNDKDIKQKVESQMDNIRLNEQLKLSDNEFFLSFLSDGNDIEAELIKNIQLRDEVILALVKSKTRRNDNEKGTQAKENKYGQLSDDELIVEMRNSKASYAGFLAGIIESNPYKKKNETLIPKSVIDTFKKLKEWGLSC